MQTFMYYFPKIGIISQCFPEFYEIEHIATRIKRISSTPQFLEMKKKKQALVLLY